MTRPAVVTWFSGADALTVDHLPEPARDDARFQVAWEALDEADAVSTTASRGGGHRVWVKPDDSPVTDLDVRLERSIGDRIRAAFSADVLRGEELTPDRDDRDLWIVDPFDGTANFLEGIPLYAHLLARVERGVTVFAIVSAPGMGRRWWAYRGHGAFIGTQRISVSATRSVAGARICVGGIRDYRPDEASDLFRLLRRCRRIRGFGNFAPYLLVAEGTYDLASCGAGSSIWDVAPVALVLAEAGGRLTALSGAPWDLASPTLASNTLLYPEALALLRGCRRTV